jgi:hypothetical protein
MTPRHLNGVPLWMSAMSPTAGELRACSMNAPVQRRAAQRAVRCNRMLGIEGDSVDA